VGILSLHSKKVIFALGIFVLLFSFGAYIFTLCPSVSWGDSGEFIVASYLMLIAHPTGYPLYTLLGKLFTYLPIGSIAYRVNLMSALFASLACFILYVLLLKLTKSPAASAVSSLILAFSYTFWSQAVIAEVYTLHVFFMLLLILIALKWKETESPKFLYLFSGVFALSICNHLVLTIVLFPGLLYFILVKKHQKMTCIQVYRISMKTIIMILLVGIISLIPYVYLPIRSLQQSELNNIEFTSLKNLINYVSGGYFSQFIFKLSFSEVISRLFYLFYDLAFREFTLIGMVIASFGLICMFQNNRVLFFSSILIICSNIILTIVYPVSFNINEIWVWYLPLFSICSIAIGFGLIRIGNIFGNLKLSPPGIESFLFLAIPFLLIITNVGDVDRSKDYSAENYAQAILTQVKNNSIIISHFGGDTTGPVYYMQYVLGERNDIYFDTDFIIIQKITKYQKSILTQTRSRELLAGFIARNINNHSVYLLIMTPQEIVRQHQINGALKEIQKADLKNITLILEQYETR
jgi:hypothetical protein